MALIKEDNLNRLVRNRNTVHQIVEATYSFFYDEQNNKYFQLDTYGSKNRQMKGRTSQSIQLDEHTARKLIKILSKEYDIKIDL